MILIPTDEADAYDRLAILWIKRDEGLKVQDEIDRLQAALKERDPSLPKVIKSKEFFVLLKANQSTFDAIERAWHGVITAKRVQEINQLRFKAKQKLQRRFWKSSPLLEKKTRTA